MPSPEEYRSLELEAAAATGVARQQTVLGNFVKFGVPIAAVLFVAWFIYTASQQKQTSMTTPDKEDFRTTQFPAPNLNTPAPQTDQGRFTIPPAPEVVPNPPPAPPQALPPPPAPEPIAPPVVTNDDDEARRLAELERQRQEAERLQWERFRSPQVIGDNSSNASGTGNLGDQTGAGGVADADNDPNRRFLASASNTGVETARATKNNRIDALVPQGTMIRAVLETAVQSDLPGMVRAVVTEDVWSFDGRRILIPAGSRLIGEYKSGIAVGQTRVFVVWTRMLRSDGVSVQLGSTGADGLGRAGNAGFVDNHYLERFGAAIMLSIVGGGAQYIAGLGQNYNSSVPSTTTTTDPVTGQVTTIQTQPNQQTLQARQIAAANVSQTLTQIADEALRNSINIPPTIYLDQGTRVIVFVRRDLDFSAFYPDPVKEALQELKRGRYGNAASSLPR